MGWPLIVGIVVIVVNLGVLMGLIVSDMVTLISPELSCTQDGDCVPAQCCHATSAINKDYGPNCREVACTLECQEGTLDCGQGEIKCVAGKCTVILNE